MKLIFLIQIILYSLVWLFDEYIGLLLSLIVGIICLGLLIFAVIAEKVQKSKVPKSYFYLMLVSCLAPIIVSIFFTFLFDANFDWLKN